MTGLRGWKIAKIHGVDVKLHFSLIFLLLYVVFIAGMQFPAVVRQSGIAANTILGGSTTWGLIFAVGLFLSVLIHEFGHVLVAQRLGVTVRGVTLMMLGGISEMENMPNGRYSEFKLSIIGPIVSLILGFALISVENLTDSGSLGFFSYWLGRVNVMLGVFNLLPAFPLDGGRAVRSLLASKQGLVKGTQNAVRVSKIFAWALGVMGFLGFNLLLMFIAFFIYAAANQELFFLLTKDELKDVRASEIAIKIPAIADTDTLVRAAESMISTRHRMLPVSSASGNSGIISINELRRIPSEKWGTILVKQIMSESTIVAEPDDPVSKFVQELSSSPSQAIPVREDGEITGLIRFSDISAALQLKSIKTTKKAA